MVYGFGFVLFRIMFALAFFLVIGMFLVFAVKGIAQWNQNNHSPRLTVPAVIVAKRTNVIRHHHGGVQTALCGAVDFHPEIIP